MEEAFIAFCFGRDFFFRQQRSDFCANESGILHDVFCGAGMNAAAFDMNDCLCGIKVFILSLIHIFQEVSRQKLDEISQTKNHKGVIALVSAHDYVEVEDILAAAKEKGEDPFVLLLDGITDPHNLGAILRTAECAGVHGVIITKRRSVGLNATVGKTSAGAIEYMPVARVTNIVQTMEYLKKEGLWIACADMKGLDHFDTNMKGPLALVIGSEGDGVSRLVKENCDFTASIPMYGKISSLNASVAAALLMYEVVRQRRF